MILLNRRNSQVAGQSIRPVDHFARVSRHSPKNGSHRAVRTVVGFIRNTTGSQIGEQVMVFLLMPIVQATQPSAIFVLLGELPLHITPGIEDHTIAQVTISVAAVSIFVNFIPAVWYVSTLA